jgi:hypothetical protein
MAGVDAVRRAMLLDNCAHLHRLTADLHAEASTGRLLDAEGLLVALARELRMAADTLAAIRAASVVSSPPGLVGSPVPHPTDVGG